VRHPDARSLLEKLGIVLGALVASLEFNPGPLLAYQAGAAKEPLSKTVGDWKVTTTGVPGEGLIVTVQINVTTAEQVGGSRLRLTLLDLDAEEAITTADVAFDYPDRSQWEWRIYRSELPAPVPERLAIGVTLI
jgi:hypothetical protein